MLSKSANEKWTKVPKETERGGEREGGRKGGKEGGLNQTDLAFKLGKWETYL